MYLSKLEIFGFKSFANRTIVNFTKGMTGIVGPNGCGKSNIVDSIRWVLGEQKSSALRSDKMEAVIFNGTRTKKPMGMAEVSLTIVNDKGILPTEYSEVTITRRIFRSGESEYLLNKNVCRLKDITNLFMDTGMATNAYSVIELKMIENILSGRADERSKLFEEAAGVNKYKLRRKLSLRKLDEVKSDLVRVNDIVSEVEKTVRSLERQAKKADKYNQIQSLLKEKEVDLSEREYSLGVANIRNLIEQRNVANERKEEIDKSIRTIETELIEYRTKINEIEKELGKKRYELSQNTERLHNVQKNISVAEERDRSLKNNLSRYQEELEEFRDQLLQTEEAIELYKGEIKELEQLLEEKKVEIIENESSIIEKKEKLEETRKELKQKNEEILEIHKILNTKENQISANRKSLNKLNKDIEKLEFSIQKATEKIAKTVGYLEDLSVEKEEVQKQFEESENLYTQKQKEKESLEHELSDLRNKELEEKNVINELRNKIELFQTLIANLEGVSKGSKALMESDSWTTNDKTLFADVGNTEEEYRFALEAALKSVLNNLLIEKFDELSEAINYLKENDLGKASFFLLDLPTVGKKSFFKKIYDYGENKKRKKLQNEKAFIGWAFEYVRSAEQWKPYFNKILNNCAIASSLEAALELHREYPNYTFVTLDGDYVQTGGLIEAGSSPKLDETLFGRKQMLDELKKEFPKYEANLVRLQEVISEKEEELAAIDLKAISDQGRAFLNDINNLEKQISQFEFEKTKANEDIEKTQKQIQELANEASQIGKVIDEVNEEYQQVAEKETAKENEISEFEIGLKDIEEGYSRAQNEHNQAKVALERSKGKLQNTKNALTTAENSIDRIKSSIEKREKDISSALEETHSIQSIIEDNQIEYDEIYGERSQLKEQESGIKERLNTVKGEAAKFESELSGFRNERQVVSDKIHSFDIQLSELKIKVERLVEYIQEEYSLELEVKEYEDFETFNFRETKSEVQKLKHELKTLGPINLLAYSEYEEEKERLDFLHKQRDDLLESERDLIKTINEINETAQKLFLETFEQIRLNFVQIFQSLFNPGDEANLILQEGVDPLEAKIEIMAKPKGKRPTGIELLSGGEKTLTATALLFAIYLVKPSPFCILDEVDAPLDDANVGRFTNLLKDFSTNTQFIVVTHNKKTMIAAENMYGVTMMEEGISKLAAVQFNEQITVKE